MDAEGNVIGYVMNKLSDTTLMSLILDGKQGLTARDIQDFKDMAKILDDAGLPHGDIDPRNIAKDLNGNWVLYDPIPVGSIESELVIYRPITNPGDLPSYIVNKGPNITYSEDGQWLYEVQKRKCL
jgi:hypothetical protein